MQAVLASDGGQLAIGGGAAALAYPPDAAEAAAHAAAAAEEAHPGKRTRWQAPEGRRGRAFVRSLSRSDSSAPGRREQPPDTLLRLASDDEGSGPTEAFLQDQLQAFSTPCSAGEQQEGAEGLRLRLSGLVGVLLEGPSQSLFEGTYQPWLKAASPCRLAAEHSTFECYLGMLRGGMDWRAGLLLRILRGREDAGGAALAEQNEQRRKRRRRCAAQAAALRAAGIETDGSMSQSGSLAAACCWQDTASSCTTSDDSDDTSSEATQPRAYHVNGADHRAL
ncbi:hypothetical protein ABPG75_005300 [Micractinium tetrahymenae]